MKYFWKFSLWGLVALFLLSACGTREALPQPPVGGGIPENAQPVENVPLPTGGRALRGGGMPDMAFPSPPMPGAATMDDAPTAASEWRAIQAQASAIQERAQQMQPAWQQVLDGAAWIQQHEQDPEVLHLAAQMADLASQALQDAAQLAVTADDINYRIDHSEATTLRLSDDIGVMADRIGEMADRILWTELQIGIMADRIVHSEHLINDGTQQTIDQIQESLDQIAALVRDVMAQTEALRQSLPQEEPVGDESQGTNPPTAGDDQEALPREAGTPSGATPRDEDGQGPVDAGSVGGGAVTGGAAPSPEATPSPRRLEVLARSVYCNASAMQEQIRQAKADALVLGQDALAEHLAQAEQTLAQIALIAGDLNAYAQAADIWSPTLTTQTQQATTQIEALLTQLDQALAQAQALVAQGAPSAQQQRIQRALDTAQVLREYLGRWNAEMRQMAP